MFLKLLKVFYRFITLEVNFKTLRFNFKYLKFKDAIQIPIVVSSKLYLREMAGKVVIQARDLSFGMITIGNGKVGIFDDKLSRSIWEVSGTVIFKGTAHMGHGSKVSVGKKGQLVFGDNFYLTAESAIVAATSVVFGDNCLLSWDILIMDTDFHDIKNEKGEIINHPSPIVIGNKVWIGCRNLILKGTAIPNNCIIGAGSVISKQLSDEYSLFAGNPVKKLKENVSW